MLRHCRRAGQEVSVSRALPNRRISPVRVSLAKLLQKWIFRVKRTWVKEILGSKVLGTCPSKHLFQHGSICAVSDGRKLLIKGFLWPCIIILIYSSNFLAEAINCAAAIIHFIKCLAGRLDQVFPPIISIGGLDPKNGFQQLRSFCSSGSRSVKVGSGYWRDPWILIEI